MHLLILLSVMVLSVRAQFQFFENFFGGDAQQQRHEPQNVPSDSAWYRDNYAKAPCSNYLCPDTLACVHFPHHCPCAFPENEDKVELGEGIAVCASKGGYKSGETIKKIELARKGLL
ncbi:uncharacterized protein PV09_02138 [Verruconis gallopava]|uniref:Long chronological lifespan protein 2 n=1 Tax=Verruconis gallopava TaxID=253628 RepID=A0A0D2B7R4_9PEZI|nr:uncharacterized protein PV09_02138 [Verruconis gallopava]KIW07284.1 hypothetical protein PV09_02138 [Verruconis gallopava]